jgi:hypothetical protein
MHSTHLPPSTYWKHHFGILTENKVLVFRFIEDRIFDKNLSSLKSRNRGKKGKTNPVGRMDPAAPSKDEWRRRGVKEGTFEID